MKLNGIFYLTITSLVLVALVILVHFDTSFELIFFLTTAGQLLLVYTVYKILTDDYKTERTFDDWYQDEPLEKKEQGSNPE